MGSNEPNKPDNKEHSPDQPLQAGGETSAPEITAEEAAALAGEGEKASRDIGEEQLEPPAPFDMGGEHPPDPGDGLRLTGVTFIKGTAKEAEQTAGPDKEAPAPIEEQTPVKKGRGRPPKAEKAPDKPRAPKQEKPDKPTEKKATGRGGVDGSGQTAPAKEKAPPAPAEPEQPPIPREAIRSGEIEQIVYLNLAELHPFKNHPFSVRDDAEMRSLTESVKAGGVNQPALVRPHPDGNGYEIIAGHRRQRASELAGFFEIPCIVRNLTDDEAILAMTDDNLRQRSEILPSEKAVSLKMQVEAIKHQGARNNGDQKTNGKDAGQRPVDIVGERNGMSPKQVQRYVRLTDLVPDLVKMMDDKKLGFTTAFEFSFIKPKNQNLIAVSIEGQQAKPTEAQAKRLRELDGEGKLNGDMIDGILCDEKREVDKVIISGDELQKYFGNDKTPRQMKDQIIKLLDDWAGKEKAIATPEKKPGLEK